MKKLMLLLVVLFSTVSCNKNIENTDKFESSDKTKNTDKEKFKHSLVFSCIQCKGCIAQNIKLMKLKGIDKEYKIYLDTLCFEGEQLKDFKFTHMNNKEIEKEFGIFGNFLLIDDKGEKLEFETDMIITDYVK